MKPSTDCLDLSRVEALISGDLSSPTLKAVEAHLSVCEACRLKLEATIGSGDWWGNASEWLQDEIDPQSVDDRGLNFDGMDDGDVAKGNSRNPVISELLDLLAPTEYPDMLGRLGPYEIAGVLGHGGMGGVFRAFDRSLHRFVAIKMMLPHLAVSAASRARFAREAKAIAAVVDDHVMAVHGVDQWKSVPYFVMPLLRGESLRTRLDDHGTLGIRETLRISMQAARGLAASHAQGIVHRDVKPANIFLDGETDRAQLMDFGIAVALDDPSLTKTGLLAGTPQFMSPEQARGETVTASSDLFSLGTVIYSMCTGRAPFHAETAYGVLRLITDKPARPMQELNPDVPAWLDDVVSKLMAKEPVDRFESAREVADLLQGCLAHVQQPTSVALPVALDTIRPTDHRLIDRTRVSTTWLVAVLGSISLVILGAANFFATGESPSYVHRVEMIPHQIVVDGRDRLSVDQLWDQWKEMPIGSSQELRAQRRLLEVYQDEIGSPSDRNHLRLRRQWATEIMPLVTSGVPSSKADFLLLFLQPLDPSMRSHLEIPSLDKIPPSANGAEYPFDSAVSDLDNSYATTSGWDVHTALAMALGRSGRHTDAELVINNLVDQIHASMEAHGSEKEVQYLGYYQPIRAALNWSYFYRATIKNMAVQTLEKNLQDNISTPATQ